MAAQQYDSISTTWASLEDLPSERVANSLLESTLQDLPRDLRLLDFGGGTGTYARMALRLGVANEADVVDLSPEMLNVGATIEEKARPSAPRIRYHLADCIEPLSLAGVMPGSFDLVMANYFFPYATTRRQLISVWSNVATYLKPGGRFVGLIPRADLQAHLKREPWSGLTYKYLGQEGESNKLQITFHCEPEVQVDQYMLPENEYLETCAEVGMTDIKFCPPTKSHLPQPLDEAERQRYTQYLLNPVSDLCTAVKAT